MTDDQKPQQLLYEEDEANLFDILITLAESWKLLVFGPLFVGVVVGALSFLWPNTYQSVAVARLAEEEAALFHVAPVLDPLLEKFGYLDRAGGIREDARNALKIDLVYTQDKKTQLVTLLAAGRTPEQAQALGRAAFEALFIELAPKGKEKETILKEMAINSQLIAAGVVYVERSVDKQNPVNAVHSKIANLKLNNLELQVKLQAKGGEVFVQEPSLPQRRSTPKRGRAVIIAMLASGFALLVTVLVRKAWQQATRQSENAEKIKRIKAALGMRVGV